MAALFDAKAQPGRDAARDNILVASKALRALACALVVLVHVNIAIRPGMVSWWPAGIFFAPVFGFAVPAFFMMSGFFSGRFSPAVTRPGMLTFLGKKFRTLVAPFLIWSTILTILDTTGNRPSPIWMICYIATGYWQLYYLFVLLQLLLLQYLLEPLLAGRMIRRVFAVAAFAALAAGVAADYMLWTRGSVSEAVEYDLCRTFLPWAVFYVAGIWLSREGNLLERLERKTGWLVGLTAAAYVAYYLELRGEAEWLGYNPVQQLPLLGIPFRLLSPVLALLILKRLAESGRLRRVVLFFASGSKDSYGIYLCHTSLLICLWSLWRASGADITHWIEVPILAVATWLTSLILIRIVRYTRLHTLGLFLFGTVSQRHQVGKTG